MPHIVMTHGPTPGRRVELADSTVVGRHSSCTISIDDDRISRRHCEFRITPSGVTLTDLGSGNGTRVNGVTITETVSLQAGDAIEVGGTRFVFEPPADGENRFATRIIKSIAVKDTSQIQVNLGVLYEAATAVSQIADTDEMLGRVLDLLLRATRADHAGSLLIDSGTGEIMPRVVRSAPGRESAFAFSRTIVEHVRRENRGILVSDAGADDRFAGRESVVRQQLRDVIAVPLAGRHEPLGVLLLDTLGVGATVFTADHLHLAVAVAHQAALALEESKHYRALMDAERLAAVGQTIAGMSHHIKNIMTGVRFGSDMVRTGLAEDDRNLIGKGWKLVEKNQARIDALIMDMLNYSKEREPLLEPTDLAKLIRDVAEGVAGLAASRTITLNLQLPETMTVLACDPHGIHQAVLNVVTNALDAVEAVENAAITLALMIEPTQAVITVADNGPGVPTPQREAIFQPFVSSKGNRGTGLGLAVSRKALREHGGDIVVQNAPAGGAVFVLTLPRTATPI